jgi:copper chaperone CopZ
MISMRKSSIVLMAMELVLGATILVGCSSKPNGAGSAASPATQPTRTATIDDQPIKASIATLVVHGMGCPQCSTNVDKQLMAVPGVQKVQINLGTGEVDVRLVANQQPTGNQLAAAIKKSGYTLVRIETAIDSALSHGNGTPATVEK